ncbi:MAG: DRTGG domain-containing protein [Xenococcaceae cyanobacterium MO_167.B52]|nr:DRTGG domain-containing protein [Xenococcaceae cyanobacterium MO_167.B52]
MNNLLTTQTSIRDERLKQLPLALLNAKVLYGEKRLDNLVLGYVIAAMQLEHAIARLKEDSLVISLGDRSDIIVGLLQAHL